MIIKKDKDTIKNYFEDNSGVKHAYADFVAIAENDEEVGAFLEEMSKTKTPVTVAGALTGNTASALAFGGAVLSLEKLNNIGEIAVINKNEAEITVGAGARLSDIKAKAAAAGWFYPPDPTEKNATIGGNISTNASGGRGFKFGVTRDYVKEITIVFTDGSKARFARGEIFADNSGRISFQTDKGVKNITLPKYKLPRIKNAAGYYNYPNADLIDVFIGSDGTLGVIIEAKLKLIMHFKEVFGGIVFFETLDKAYDFVKIVKEKTNAMSLEFFDRNALGVIKEDYPVIPQNAAAGIMFEQDVYGNDFDVLMEKWVSLIEQSGIDSKNVWFGENEAEQEKFRTFRHRIPERVNERVRKNGVPKVGTDFAVPEGKLAEMVDFCEKEFEKSGLFYLTFGHIGENHLHANIIAANEAEYQKARNLYSGIAQKAVELGGYIPLCDHGVPDDVNFENYCYYDRRRKEIFGLKEIPTNKPDIFLH